MKFQKSATRSMVCQYGTVPARVAPVENEDSLRMIAALTPISRTRVKN
jgi:hypothetical protein